MSIHDRGFASMSKERQLELASKGGKAAHQKGTARKWTAEEAREAAWKAALARAHKRDGEHADDEHADKVLQESESCDGTILQNVR